jgi:hypothetical protein
MLYFIFLFLVFHKSWNQVGVLHLKWLLLSLTVLSVPINHIHQDATVFCLTKHQSDYMKIGGKYRMLQYSICKAVQKLVF